MRRFGNFILIIALILLWILFIYQKNLTIDKRNEMLNLAKKYDEMGAFKDAIEEYKSYLDLYYDDEVENRLFELYLNIKEFNSARKIIDNRIDKSRDYKHMVDKYLYTCKEFERMDLFSQFIKSYSNQMNLEDYLHVLKGDYQVIHQDIDYILQNGEIMHLVEKNNKKIIINNGGRIIYSNPDYDIQGFDEKSKLVTCKKDGKYYVLDFDNQIRGSYSLSNAYPMIDGHLLAEDENYRLVNRLGEQKDLGDDTSLPHDGYYVKLKGNILNICNLENKVIKKFSASEFKSDRIHRAIFDNKIIFKNEKYYIYDIKENILSQAYDDIDYSYGEYIAVKRGDDWSFIDSKFKELDSPVYSKAKSFSCGVAMAVDGDHTILIDKGFAVIRELDIEDMISANKAGISFVKNGEKWKMVKFQRVEDVE